MAAENIGALIPTKIPGYADAADIQAALRVYHYGSYSYDTANTSAASLVNPSIAYTLNDLQDQIDSIDTGGIQSSIFTGKGQLISSSATDTPLILSTGSNNQILVANSATATGLQWTSTLTAPTLTSPIVDGSGIIFEGATANDFETTLTVVDPTADRTVTIPDESGTVAFKDLNINQQTGTTYTAVLADSGKFVTFDNGSAVSFTIPANSSVAFATGSQINILQKGTGQVTVVADSGVTINSASSLSLRTQWSAATLIKLDTNSWTLTGDIE